jgi:hypothetical protein
MKKSLIVLLAAGALTSNIAFAEQAEEVVYSTEGYCLLSNEGASDEYLKAYAKKLGAKPTNSVCSSFKKIVEESRPREWDYPAGRAYPGSVIKLSPSQVALLKSLKKKDGKM